MPIWVKYKGIKPLVCRNSRDLKQPHFLIRRLKSLRDSIVNPAPVVPGWQSGLIQRSRLTLWSLYAAGSRPVVS